MKAGQTFANWPAEAHETKDQQTRLKSAKASKTTPQSIDRENKTGIFPGSGASPYVTTLESCTCPDFSRRHLPCKHMYRLAIELGELNERAETGINKNLQISLEDAVAELENLSEQCQMILMPCLWNDGGALHICEQSEETEALRSCRLVVIKELTDAAEDILSSNYRGKDIAEICERHGIKAPEHMSKRRLIEWSIENASNCFIAFAVSEEFRSSRRDTYIYLKRKYDWEYFTGGKYPYGSTGTKKYYFPDDKITELLTLYGHNRCLNGFDLLPNDLY